ncbi:PhoH family protein [Clostridium bowmanii]|uniref:PhoH family protein n=1 Tax=Clostridium bowmanii TaxID=132925 RepID=UPI001C0B1608|nr:PhoH family protein [Clostridium bowmanii]MBU3188333.1 PhoH family protein [Clostridium bowmanii]MCA1072721.1 PhoH family protein [Clostridium bowmanii]
MARMIPSVISPEVKSNAERKIFEWFRDDCETEGWIVLHSLGIANHRTVLYGEIDFFVIAPKLGVFALEVKGGRVKRKDGIWNFTNKYGQPSSKKRGPFEQANEGVFSLFDSVKKKCGPNHHLSKLLFATGVMFPDITFYVDDMDGEQWQVFDKNDGKNVSGFIRRLSKNIKRKWEEKYGAINPDKLPDIKAVREFANILRGDFDKAVSFSTQINYAEKALISLTGEQLKCLDQLEDNSRCLIQGPAGTGKTLLAIEEVKKSVAKGEKVAFFCFNTMLGNWLKSYFDEMDESLRPEFVGTFHSFLYWLVNSAEIGVHYPQNGNMQRFYREEIPLIALEALEGKHINFDKIVVDEAQDLLNTNYLDIMDLILKGGIYRGKWSMFGDFAMQAIFSGNVNAVDMKELLEERTSFIKYKLKINCRNTKPIGNEIKYITGFDNPNYMETNVVGPPVNYITYKNDEEQKEKLEELLSTLKIEKVDNSKITILSPVKRENSVVNNLNLEKVKDYNPRTKGSVSFSTIQAFKGLENSVIILTDIDTFEHEKIMYIGLSRARTVLYVFETEHADKERNKLLVRWL